MNTSHFSCTPCIAAVGTALPGPAISNADLSNRLGVNEDWIAHFIGTKTRHFGINIHSGAMIANLSDICTEAAALALERAGLSGKDIDFVVMGTASPDELMPATVNRVADRLGIDQVPTYQLQSGCCGAVQALDLGALLLQRSQHHIGLVIGGDVCGKHLRLDRDFSQLAPSELVNYMLFGDGAGAAVLTRDPVPGGMLLRTLLNQLTGFNQEPGQLIRWFGEADFGSGLDSRPQAVEENYKAIEQRVPVMAKEILFKLLELTDWKMEEIDYLLPPQLSGRMTAQITKKLELIHAREISCVAETGNNGNALPFLQMERLSQQALSGKKALAISVESSKWIKGGFALEGI
jgi:3-oxoacyl-[acyl-carrier-protein] synthase III